VAYRRYAARQIATLLRFAKETTDPNISAALVEKAASLKEQADETIPPPDRSPIAPDVERPPSN
jgi:hypothetical protein